MTIKETIFRGINRWKHVEARIEELGYVLPSVAPNPKGNYIPFTISGNLVYLSGHLPQDPNGNLTTGRLGEDMSIEDGKKASEQIALNLLASLRTACDGDLDKVTKIVKVVGFVNSTSTFTDQAKVMNGCSDFLVCVFGDRGRHARSAIGTSVLPLGVPIEIEAIVEIDLGE